MKSANHTKQGFLHARVKKPLRFHSTRFRPKQIRTYQTNRFVEPVFAPHLIPRGKV